MKQGFPFPGSVVIAVDVGGTSAKGGRLDQAGNLTGLRFVPLTSLRGRPAIVPAVVDFAAGLVDEARADLGRSAVAAVGLAVPGLVDLASGVGVSSMILGWRRVPFVQLVEAATGLPVGFGHDVRLAASAELRSGAGAGREDFLFVTLGTGVGAAFVARREIYTGGHGLGGELAHVVVEPGGTPCRCGKRGCLEMVSSGDAVAAAYARARPDAGLDAEQVVQAVAAGDELARAVWQRCVAGLAAALTTYVEMMDPEVVVLGGGMAAAGRALFEPLAAALAEGVSLSHVPALVPSAFGGHAGIHGAASAAWDRVLRAGPREAHPSGTA